MKRWFITPLVQSMDALKRMGELKLKTFYYWISEPLTKNLWWQMRKRGVIIDEVQRTKQGVQLKMTLSCKN